MNDFIVRDNFLVLNKSERVSKNPDEKGNYKKYFSISLYSKLNDGFEKILIFDKSIFDRYEVLKSYNIDLKVSFYKDKTGKEKRSINIQ